MNTFTEWIQQQLDERDWKRSVLARQAGISESTLSNIMNGNRNAGMDAIVSIAKGFKLPPEIALRKAGIIPDVPDDDPQVKQIVDLARNLSPQKRREAASYLLWLFERRGDE